MNESFSSSFFLMMIFHYFKFKNNNFCFWLKICFVPSRIISFINKSLPMPVAVSTSLVKLVPLYTNLFSTNQRRVSQECRTQTRNPDQRRSSEELPRYYGCFETPSLVNLKNLCWLSLKWKCYSQDRNKYELSSRSRGTFPCAYSFVFASGSYRDYFMFIGTSSISGKGIIIETYTNVCTIFLFHSVTAILSFFNYYNVQIGRKFANKQTLSRCWR